MKNSILVTITTLHSSKQYTITQLIKKFIISIIIFGILLMIGTFFFIKYLNSVIDHKNMALEQSKKEINTIINQKKQLQTKIVTLENNISYLENNITLLEKTIQKKEQFLNEVNDKIEDLERIIQFNPPKNINIQQRIDLAKFNVMDKTFILHNIPSGSPVPYKGISSKFGWRTHPLLHKKEFHTGLDMRASMNTPVRATADGIVEFAKYHKRSGYGRLIIIDHNYGFKTLFGHLNKIKVRAGQFVKKGQIIAYTGNSGLSSGPHLHYEIRYIGMVLNPIYFVRWNLKNYNYLFKVEKKVDWNSIFNLIETQKQFFKMNKCK